MRERRVIAGALVPCSGPKYSASWLLLRCNAVIRTDHSAPGAARVEAMSRAESRPVADEMTAKLTAVIGPITAWAARAGQRNAPCR